MFIDKDQFKNGKQVEYWLDHFFQDRGWSIRTATPHEERTLKLGDRFFKKDDFAYWVEYKSGIQTYFTGNVFLETISVDSENIPGWVYTCQADYIFYATLLNMTILIMNPVVLRDCIAELRQRFREVKTSNGQNDGYNTHGVIVPYEYAKRRLCSKVIGLHHD